MTGFVNGQLVGQASDLGIGTRGGSLALGFGMQSIGEDGDVEIEFDDFKVFALGG